MIKPWSSCGPCALRAPWACHSSGFWSDYQSYWPFPAEWASTWSHAAWAAPRCACLRPETTRLCWCLAAGNWGICPWSASKCGLHLDIGTLEVLDEIFPLLSPLLNQLSEPLFLLRCPALPGLGHESAIPAVAHFLSPILHMKVDLFPRHSPPNQLEQLFIFLCAPHLLAFLVPSSQELLSGKLQATLWLGSAS